MNEGGVGIGENAQVFGEQAPELGFQVDVFDSLDGSTEAFSQLELVNKLKTFKPAELKLLAGQVYSKIELRKKRDSRAIPIEPSDGLFSRKSGHEGRAGTLARTIINNSPSHAVTITGDQIRDMYRLTPDEENMLKDPHERGKLAEDEVQLAFIEYISGGQMPYQAVRKLTNHLVATVNPDSFINGVEAIGYSPNNEDSLVVQVNKYVQRAWRDSKLRGPLGSMIFQE